MAATPDNSFGQFLGCISGTSVDGLDIAHVDIQPDGLTFLHATTVPLPTALREELLALGTPGDNELDRSGACDADLGDFIGAAICDFMQRHAVNASDLVAIGSHGQTIRHRPPGTREGLAFTIQIGDANRIAERTGITTVADFRRRDMAAGGHGAPLVPPFHQQLFPPAADTSRVVLNVGGISNVSILRTGHTSGFDTGPGNALMDIWVNEHQQTPFDTDGAWAAGGIVLTELLDIWLQDPYFAKPAPKSTGREYFDAAWLRQTPLDHYAPRDVQATLCELTARCNIDALPADCAEVVVCGGGRHNASLMQRLASGTGVSVTRCETYQVDGDAVEAAAFAWLAHRTLAGKPGNAPAVTGAHGPRVLGAIYPA